MRAGTTWALALWLVSAPCLANPRAEAALPSPVPKAASSARAGSVWEGARGKAWIPALLGGVLVAEGISLRVVAKNVRTDLVEGRKYIGDTDRLARLGRTYEWVGTASIVVGALALGTATAMFFLDQPRVSASIAPTPGSGAMAVFSARWP